ncbi:hypothetical protein LOTGIDRAFT_166168 [Lottia gigantea]|uniref:DNA-directed DNA polymerase n=1 Tax=Lottia gigantea TaxID=225164 RepID=V3ZU40_LOTGI|nr:hypothetical protein LOTGIDRAFT_166168 [Lottia gigantea]ESO87867.1 hypothetical protein LOTGIDRAFT_166168 [Lottia gigantea]
MDEICDVLKEYTELESSNIIDLFKEYSKRNKDKTEVNSKLKKMKCTKLMAFDANEIAKAGGRSIRILDGIVYEENFKTPPYRDYILILRDLRNKYKREDGFYKPEIYYTDTDNLYISSSNWDKLNEAGLVSENDYCKGKNDYGDGGIIYGLYLAPKVKYYIILTSGGILKDKKTFKGYSNDKISVEDYIQLASGHDLTNEFKKRWENSFTNGIVIPKDDDKQKKVLEVI